MPDAWLVWHLQVYTALREQGLDDETARLQVARHLGHNRTRVTVQSYVAAQRPDI